MTGFDVIVSLFFGHNFHANPLASILKLEQEMTGKIKGKKEPRMPNKKTALTWRKCDSNRLRNKPASGISIIRELPSYSVALLSICGEENKAKSIENQSSHLEGSSVITPWILSLIIIRMMQHRQLACIFRLHEIVAAISIAQIVLPKRALR